VGVAREAYKEAGLQGPSAVVALPAACLVNTGPYRALRYILHTFDRVLRTSAEMRPMLQCSTPAALLYEPSTSPRSTAVRGNMEMGALEDYLGMP
jgi:hypothetical protein